MNIIARRIVSSFVLGALLATQPACFGSFKLTRGIYDFNRDVSGEKFIRWLVFLGLVIIPVYAIGSLGDALIFNTIEFWGGGSSKGLSQISDNEQLAFERSEDGMITVRHLRDGVIAGEWTFEPSQDGLALRDASGAIIAYAQETQSGGTEVRDGNGVVLATE